VRTDGKIFFGGRGTMVGEGGGNEPGMGGVFMYGRPYMYMHMCVCSRLEWVKKTYG